MTFNDLHLKNLHKNIKAFFTLIQHLLIDKRLRTSISILIGSLLLMMLSSGLFMLQKKRMDESIIKLSAQTTEILRRVEVNKHQIEIPKFETSMKTVGAYQPSITSEACASHIARCFLQKNKPQITINTTKQEMEPLYTVQSFYVKFQSSFDYEIFDMMEYILSTPTTFGYTRLREFEIEQLFEKSPIVKGHFVYDQLSLTP